MPLHPTVATPLARPPPTLSQDLSFFRDENEVLMLPNRRFLVTRPLYMEDGWAYVDLMEAVDEYVF